MTGGKTNDTTPSIEAAVLEFIRGLRSVGVLKFKGWAPLSAGFDPLSIEVELSMREPAPEFKVPVISHEKVNELDNPDDIDLPASDVPVPIGHDGLTPEQQVDLYGRVIDAVPRDDEE